jgi:hypothetical protein
MERGRRQGLPGEKSHEESGMIRHFVPAGIVALAITGAAQAEMFSVEFVSAVDDQREIYLFDDETNLVFSGEGDLVDYSLAEDRRSLCMGEEDNRICMTFDAPLKMELGAKVNFSVPDGPSGSARVVAIGDRELDE